VAALNECILSNGLEYAKANRRLENMKKWIWVSNVYAGQNWKNEIGIYVTP
jgi:hypothetical protein